MRQEERVAVQGSYDGNESSKRKGRYHVLCKGAVVASRVERKSDCGARMRCALGKGVL